MDTVRTRSKKSNENSLDGAKFPKPSNESQRKLAASLSKPIVIQQLNQENKFVVDPDAEKFTHQIDLDNQQKKLQKLTDKISSIENDLTHGINFSNSRL